MLYFINKSLLKELDSDIYFRTRLAAEMNISERAIYNIVKRCLEQNMPNTSLTKLSAIAHFRKQGYKDEDIYHIKKQPAMP